MPNYTNGKSQDVPNQVTNPSDASKGYRTDVDGKVYPEQIDREAAAYLEGEGSMGYDRDQGVKRDNWGNEVDDMGMLGQHKLQRLKSTQAGSHAI